MQTTITEALAELKTIAKRLDKKQQFVLSYIGRQAIVRDPFEQEGGAVAKLTSERQAITDLSERIVKIRSGIQKANQSTTVAIEGVTRSIAEWLTWRKEVAPRSQAFLGQMRNTVASIRNDATKKGGKITEEPSQNVSDLMIHINESELAKEVEQVELILGTLDGILSLKNATTFIEV